MGLARALVFVLIPLGAVAAGRGELGLADKLRLIVVPKLEVEEASITKVVELLRTESKLLDPDGEGVNFFLKLDPKITPEQRHQVTISLTKVALEDVVRYVCLAAGLQYKVEDNAVIIADRSLPLGQMETRVYDVGPGVLDQRATSKRAPRLKLKGEDGDRN